MFMAPKGKPRRWRRPAPACYGSCYGLRSTNRFLSGSQDRPGREINVEDVAIADVNYWIEVYSEIVVKQERTLERVRELMATHPPHLFGDVEFTNIMALAELEERFRARLRYWEGLRLESGSNKRARPHTREQRFG